MNAAKYYRKRRFGVAPAKCDVCGSSVGLGAYVFLCRDCRDKLPERIQEGHHALIDYPKIRQAILKDAMERLQNADWSTLEDVTAQMQASKKYREEN